MKNKYIMPLIVIAAFLILGIVTTASYAYYVAYVQGNEYAFDNVITTGDISLYFEEQNSITLYEAIPGSLEEKEFEIVNIGTAPTTYDLYLSEIVNTFADKKDLKYMIYTDNGCGTDEFKVVPSEVGEQSKIITSCQIEPGRSHVYSIVIKFIDDGTNQDDNQGKRFSAKLAVNEYKAVEQIALLPNGEAFHDIVQEMYEERRRAIGTINNVDQEILPSFMFNKDKDYRIENTLAEIHLTTMKRSTTLPPSTTKIYHLEADESYYDIYAWIDEDANLVLYSESDTIYLNPNCHNMFFDLPFKILDFTIFDSSKVTDMSSMFARVGYLESVNLSNLDTSNVITMQGMFSQSNLLSRLDLSSFNTSNVTDMSSMFNGLNRLTDINLSSFDTSNVRYMNGMFYNVKLTALDISVFNTANLEEAMLMFANCDRLETIYVGEGWNVNKLIISEDMFLGDYNLVGKAGTFLDSNNVDKSYAHIDCGEGFEGYFTPINLKDIQFSSIDDYRDAASCSSVQANFNPPEEQLYCNLHLCGN